MRFISSLIHSTHRTITLVTRILLSFKASSPKTPCSDGRERSMLLDKCKTGFRERIPKYIPCSTNEHRPPMPRLGRCPDVPGIAGCSLPWCMTHVCICAKCPAKTGVSLRFWQPTYIFSFESKASQTIVFLDIQRRPCSVSHSFLTLHHANHHSRYKPIVMVLKKISNERNLMNSGITSLVHVFVVSSMWDNYDISWLHHVPVALQLVAEKRGSATSDSKWWIPSSGKWASNSNQVLLPLEVGCGLLLTGGVCGQINWPAHHHTA